MGRFAHKFQSLYHLNSECSNDEIMKNYNAFVGEMRSDVQSIHKKSRTITNNEFKILQHELRTAGNLKLIECASDSLFTSIFENKISNHSNVRILNALKVENKFANYSFDQYRKQIQDKATSEAIK